MDTSTKLAETQDLAGKIASLFRKRTEAAVADHAARVQAAHTQYAESCKAIPGNMQQSWTEPYYYAVDFLQRSILFWDALRQRGNDYVERDQKGVTPVLKFDYEMIADALDERARTPTATGRRGSHARTSATPGSCTDSGPRQRLVGLVADGYRIAFDSNRADPDPDADPYINDIFTMKADGSDSGSSPTPSATPVARRRGRPTASSSPSRPIAGTTRPRPGSTS